MCFDRKDWKGDEACRGKIAIARLEVGKGRACRKRGPRANRICRLTFEGTVNLRDPSEQLQSAVGQGRVFDFSGRRKFRLERMPRINAYTLRSCFREKDRPRRFQPEAGHAVLQCSFTTVHLVSSLRHSFTRLCLASDPTGAVPRPLARHPAR